MHDDPTIHSTVYQIYDMLCPEVHLEGKSFTGTQVAGGRVAGVAARSATTELS